MKVAWDLRWEASSQIISKKKGVRNRRVVYHERGHPVGYM